MKEFYLDFHRGIPQYASTACRNCKSIMGKSLCSVKNRGCCWYFPKFTLVEIQRMVASLEGIDILNAIINNPGANVYNYYIHVKGDFDEASHKKFVADQDFNEVPKDISMFFRTCAFFKEGFGCSLPVRFRTHVCNFFICDELTEEASENKEFKLYLKERDSYVKFIQWENQYLESLMLEQGINLKDNFKEAIKILQVTPLSEYEFPKLDSVKY